MVGTGAATVATAVFTSNPPPADLQSLGEVPGSKHMGGIEAQPLEYERASSATSTARC